MERYAIETVISEDDYNLVRTEQGGRKVEEMLMHVVGRLGDAWTINRIIDVKKEEGKHIAVSEIMAVCDSREQAETGLYLAQQHMSDSGFDMNIVRTFR